MMWTTRITKSLGRALMGVGLLTVGAALPSSLEEPAAMFRLAILGFTALAALHLLYADTL